MVCPVLEQAGQQNVEAATEYPYEPLYRPLSWTLSTFSNFFLFAIVVLVGYALYRRRRRKGVQSGRGSCVSYRRVDQGGERDGRENILVLGGETGFGRHLVKTLLADGSYNVHCLDSYIPYQEDRFAEVCAYIQADLCCYEDMLLCVRGRKAVFHAGCLAPQHCFEKRVDFYHHNVTGTENIVRVCRERSVERLVFTSSANVVAGKKWNDKNVNETTPYPESPRNVYLGSLASAEKCVLNSNGAGGLATCVMRLAPVIWSDNDPLVDTLLSQSVLVVDANTHGVTAVDAAAAAKAHIIADKKLGNETNSVVAGKAYNLGNNTRISYKDLVGTLVSEEETIWGHSPPTEIPRYVMTILAYVNYYGYKLTGNLTHTVTISPLMVDVHTTELSFSSEQARKELGWADERGWKEAVAELVRTHKTVIESKKDQ